MDTIKIGICGLGTVGAGTYQLLHQNLADIEARAGCKIQVAAIGSRRDNPNCPTGATPILRDVFELARDPQIDIIVELIGGTDTALQLVRAAIAAGKHVVTANKALIAEFGNELLAERQRPLASVLPSKRR